MSATPERIMERRAAWLADRRREWYARATMSALLGTMAVRQ